MLVTKELKEDFGGAFDMLTLKTEIDVCDLINILYDAEINHDEIVAYFGSIIVAEYIYKNNKKKRSGKRFTLEDLETDIDINKCSVYYG